MIIVVWCSNDVIEATTPSQEVDEAEEMASLTQQEMEEWFKMYDVDGSGKVDIRELREVIRAYYVWQQVVVDDAKLDADTQVRSSTYLLTEKSTF